VYAAHHHGGRAGKRLGKYLVDLYLWGGPNVRYFALEPTSSGRACMSIEQVPELPKEALTGLFGLGESLTVVAPVAAPRRAGRGW
jgi:hypothetical protein